jgi:hypothetical protein
MKIALNLKLLKKGSGSNLKEKEEVSSERELSNRSIGEKYKNSPQISDKGKSDSEDEEIEETTKEKLRIKGKISLPLVGLKLNTENKSSLQDEVKIKTNKSNDSSRSSDRKSSDRKSIGERSGRKSIDESSGRKSIDESSGRKSIDESSSRKSIDEKRTETDRKISLEKKTMDQEKTKVTVDLLLPNIIEDFYIEGNELTESALNENLNSVIYGTEESDFDKVQYFKLNNFQKQSNVKVNTIHTAVKINSSKLINIINRGVQYTNLQKIDYAKQPTKKQIR